MRVDLAVFLHIADGFFIVTVTLLPYAIFSLFHALTFTRTTLMPQFLPPGPPTTSGGAPQPHPLSKKLQVWVKGQTPVYVYLNNSDSGVFLFIANYDSAMRVVAYAELVILVRVTLGAVTFQNSLLSPIVYAHFLRQRYYQSGFTREAIATTSKKIDDYVHMPSTPPMVVQVWEKAKMLTGRWAGSVLVPNPADADAAGPRR